VQALFIKTAADPFQDPMPMAEAMLFNCGLKPGAADLIAVARGPGSFTGIRIGMAAAKGLMWALDKPCLGVSTLEAMAWQAAHLGGLVCAVMDARRGQVYNALFDCAEGRPARLTEDRALSVAELGPELERAGRGILLTGDGAELCMRKLAESGIRAETALAPEHIRHQNAWGVALAAAETWSKGGAAAEEPQPVYLRLSQAERERLEREKR
jgi:tRNA threonylcarbamoyladenosine biosynthesis protein TsaB